jgi:hypothetical protein
LKEQFIADVGKSRHIDREAWGRRSLWRVRGENFCRLFGPLL